MHNRYILPFAVTGLLAVSTTSAHAIKLELAADAPTWKHVGAGILLYAHIIGGALGLVSGTVAVLSRKGARLHRAAGSVFFLSMFVAYAIGAGVAPFLEEQQRPNFVAGVLALYLLITAWLAARRENPAVGAPEWIGFITAGSILAAGLYFMHQGANHPSGTVDGSPPQAFILFSVFGGFAALGELNVIIRRKITGVSRISRHLWRMCASLFIAAGSFFLGQGQILPEFMLGTFWQFGPVLFPILAMLFWLILVRVQKWK